MAEHVSVFEVSTLVGGDERHILGSRRDAEYLVAVDLPFHLRQVAKGAGDTGGKIRHVAHLHQQLHRLRGTWGDKVFSSSTLDSFIDT